MADGCSYNLRSLGSTPGSMIFARPSLEKAGAAADMQEMPHVMPCTAGLRPAGHNDLQALGREARPAPGERRQASASDGIARHSCSQPRHAAIAAVKTIHTLAWLSVESCVIYTLYAGFAGRTDKRAAAAAVVVAGEALLFAGNGFRCPLTGLAVRLGAQNGSVTDIFLPKWFAHNLPVIHAPLIVLTVYLHTRNLRWSRSAAHQIGRFAYAPPPDSPCKHCSCL
jgi:hypothetical protein